MQYTDGILPLFVNTDKAIEKLDPNETVFMKDMGWELNGNPAASIGSGNTTGEGQNLLKLTPVRSTEAIPDVIRPDGYNLNRGAFYSETTQETYYFNFNANGNHGIYLIDGNTLQWVKIIIDPELGFSDEPDAFIAPHRVALRAIFDKDKNIIEKYLIFTDGRGWQKYINVIAAIETDGFNASLYPYWTLQPPHFDRRELLEFQWRPSMYKPVVSTIAPTNADAGTVNRLIDKSFQFATAFEYTDKRTTTLSPYSLPLIIKSEDYLSNPDNLPKRGKLILYAGSPMVERMLIYVRLCGGDWRLYDTIDKFSSCGANSPEIIGRKYWLRTGQWSDFNYDPSLNQIEYIFDYSKVAQIISQEDAGRLQNDMPLRSVSQGELGDSVAFGYNQYGYPNFDCELTNKFNVTVQEKTTTNCVIPSRRIRLYAYVGRCGDGFNYDSQVAYFLGTDTQMRFGGIIMSIGDKAEVFFNESKTFDLTFADRDAFICYLKGTPYYSVGQWYVVNSDNTLTKVENKLDALQDDVKTFIQNVFIAGGFFVCVFDFLVPAGRYIATLGRHNTPTSGNWRNLSTYIMGLANSRNKSASFNTDDRDLISIKPNAIVTQSKEMEIDCYSGDVDVWGNGRDLFYVYCPYVTDNGNKKFRFIEGYLYEEADNPLPVELFPYSMNHNATDDSGTYTDKNGFYFAYTKVANADDVDIQFRVKLNCAFPTIFLISTSQTGIGWRPNGPSYLNNFNGGQVGDCNRVKFRGKITNLDGTINYSNIAISIVDGSTVYTHSDGTFEMIVHNGQNTLRASNVYVNASGNFIITITGCGQIPPFQFNEGFTTCINCQERIYPINLNLAIFIQNESETSLKEGGDYIHGLVGADLGGRLMFVNPYKDIKVSSFLERDNTNATFFQALINGSVDFSPYPDIKWLAFYVSKNVGLSRYVQWVGDRIDFIDNQGVVVSDPSGASFIAITINSLYNYNVSKNFSVLAKYQFVTGDRVRVLDDGDGHLFDTTTFGDPIDAQILGTNYNQVAIEAGLLPPTTNTVLNPQTTTVNQSVTLILRYDSRFNRLQDKTGFWIEIYTPAQETEKISYCELQWFPIINNKIAVFTGYSGGVPNYNYPATVDLEFWDTYLFNRIITIEDVGNKFFNHPFESPNISDDWGANCSSCGRQNVENKNAAQIWYKDDVIKGDDFVSEGLANGLATFRSKNRKNFKGYLWGGIVGIIPQRGIIAFICENDWFCTNYNFQYIFANAQGVQIANLDDKLSEPVQKIGGNYGLALEHTSTLIVSDKFIFFYDYKNSAWVQCSYQGAIDISRNGMQSYLNVKTKFITNYNNTVSKERRFDVVSGIDRERNNLYMTFRPRRNNSNADYSYSNTRRNWDLQHQETICYSIDAEKFIRPVGFTPEAYGEIKGKQSGIEMISFAAGKPYRHFNGSNTNYLNYYGITVEPVVIGIFNKQSDLVKILQSLSLDSTMAWFADLIYTNQYNSYSTIPLNYMKRKENVYYSEVLRDFNSYPDPDPQQLFRSMIQDGKRVAGLFFACRLIGDPNNPNSYREVKNIFYKFTQSGNVQK